jgi:hypothetical protein
MNLNIRLPAVSGLMVWVWVIIVSGKGNED